jgi:hypothetical protein
MKEGKMENYRIQPLIRNLSQNLPRKLKLFFESAENQSIAFRFR